MNRKKSLNIIELLVQLVFMLVLFSFKAVTLIEDIDFKWAQDVNLSLGDYTFFDFAMTTENYFIVILIGLMVVNAIICLVSAISKDNNKDGIIHTVLAVVICIFSAIYLTSPATPTGYDVIISSTIKMLGIVCALIIAILAIIKRSKYAVPVEEKPIINNIEVTSSNADELQKYKDLLDKGVITEEEFDQKKKQLLDL